VNLRGLWPLVGRFNRFQGGFGQFIEVWILRFLEILVTLNGL